MRIAVVLIACALGNAAVVAAHAAAGAYPVKPIRLVVPGPPAGSLDIRARWLADRLSSAFGQPIIVENRPGAGGNLACEYVARSRADGYTLLLAHQGTHAVNPHLYARLSYDPFADFTPVTSVATNPLILTVHLGLPVNSIAELIAFAKGQPGNLFFGSPGVGTPPHLAAELLNRMAQMDVTHVPLKGAPQTQTELIAGRVAFTIEGPSVRLPLIRAGRLRALAVTGSTRLASLPEVPTMAESGVAGYEYVAWMGVVAPALTSPAVIERLHGAIVTALQSAQAREWLDADGAQPGGEPPGSFEAFIRAEHAKWGRIVREGGIKAE